MFGLFVENGPFMINDKGFLDYRAHAWTMTHNILYIDSPVGTGRLNTTIKTWHIYYVFQNF